MLNCDRDPKKNKSTYRTGEGGGGEEPALLCPRIWVTTREGEERTNERTNERTEKAINGASNKTCAE